MFSFFFQAEDGIRDHCVTGVQTCALPISPAAHAGEPARRPAPAPDALAALRQSGNRPDLRGAARRRPPLDLAGLRHRSEERRVGKEWRSRGSAETQKKNETESRV